MLQAAKDVRAVLSNADQHLVGAEIALEAEGCNVADLYLVGGGAATISIDAIRTITVRRGIDPRDFSLVAFGGAGPAQAGALAEELEIREVVVPVHPGAIDANAHHVKAYYGDDIAEGDVLIMNDSYMQGSHLHDVTAVGPIFFDGELIGFGAARAHWNDIGAIDPGSTMGSTDIYQVGLRLGPTRIVAKGRPIREWFDLLRLNTRLPNASIGDLGAQISAIRIGERWLSQLLERTGTDTYRDVCENIFEQARRMDREAIAAIRDGTWNREGWLDNDGIGEEPVKVVLSLTVEGERLIVDLAGTSGPMAASVNCRACQSVSLLRLAYKTMINPDRAIIGGSFETMTVRIPDGASSTPESPRRANGTSPASASSRASSSPASPKRCPNVRRRPITAIRWWPPSSPPIRGGDSGSRSSPPRAAGAG